MAADTRIQWWDTVTGSDYLLEVVDGQWKADARIRLRTSQGTNVAAT